VTARLAGWLFALLSFAWPPGAAAATPACSRAIFEGDGFVVCRYVPGADGIALAWRGRSGPIGSLPALAASLGKDAARVRFAMNAGMYDPARAPVGLSVEEGRQAAPLNQGTGAGNFFMAPNGVFWVDGGGAPHVDETAAYAAMAAQPVWATQSGPLLVQAGALHPRIMPNGTSLAVRNAVGVRRDEALFVISDKPVSFGRLARFLRDDLGCPDALYLDGAVSSLWAPELKRRDRRTGLGTFVVVMAPKAGR
jgi:uncharacterized protein YigE (DUF2233 family)